MRENNGCQRQVHPMTVVELIIIIINTFLQLTLLLWLSPPSLSSPSPLSLSSPSPPSLSSLAPFSLVSPAFLSYRKRERGMREGERGRERGREREREGRERGRKGGREGGREGQVLLTPSSLFSPSFLSFLSSSSFSLLPWGQSSSHYITNDSDKQYVCVRVCVSVCVCVCESVCECVCVFESFLLFIVVAVVDVEQNSWTAPFGAGEKHPHHQNSTLY